VSLRNLFYKQLSERTKVHGKGKWDVGTHDLDIPCGENFSISWKSYERKIILKETLPKSL
jgi:hypothetical protein